MLIFIESPFFISKGTFRLATRIFGPAKSAKIASEGIAEEYERGNIVQLSKESVRKHYIDSGHYNELYQARQTGSPEPPIPPLPDEIVESTANLYANMFERLTGAAL